MIIKRITEADETSWFGKPKKNQLKCPKCGEDLYDIKPNLILTSHPPQVNTGCLKCGYKGYRVV